MEWQVEMRTSSANSWEPYLEPEQTVEEAIRRINQYIANGSVLEWRIVSSVMRGEQ